MTRSLGMLLGGFMLGDGLLGLTAPKEWMRLWRKVGALFPGPTEEYFGRVMDLTDEYQKQAPNGLRVMRGLEVVGGLAVLLLALRGRHAG